MRKMLEVGVPKATESTSFPLLLHPPHSHVYVSSWLIRCSRSQISLLSQYTWSHSSWDEVCDSPLSLRGVTDQGTARESVRIVTAGSLHYSAAQHLRWKMPLAEVQAAALPRRIATPVPPLSSLLQTFCETLHPLQQQQRGEKIRAQHLPLPCPIPSSCILALPHQRGKAL